MFAAIAALTEATGVVLLRYENLRETWCHRTILAEWLREQGVVADEFDDDVSPSHRRKTVRGLEDPATTSATNLVIESTPDRRQVILAPEDAELAPLFREVGYEVIVDRRQAPGMLARDRVWSEAERMAFRRRNLGLRP